jgi:hypothetical protein
VEFVRAAGHLSGRGSLRHCGGHGVAHRRAIPQATIHELIDVKQPRRRGRARYDVEPFVTFSK